VNEDWPIIFDILRNKLKRGDTICFVDDNGDCPSGVLTDLYQVGTGPRVRGHVLARYEQDEWSIDLDYKDMTNWILKKLPDGSWELHT
jgi:hypothetical protein